MKRVGMKSLRKRIERNDEEKILEGKYQWKGGKKRLGKRIESVEEKDWNEKIGRVR